MSKFKVTVRCNGDLIQEFDYENNDNGFLPTLSDVFKGQKTFGPRSNERVEIDIERVSQPYEFVGRKFTASTGTPFMLIPDVQYESDHGSVGRTIPGQYRTLYDNGESYRIMEDDVRKRIRTRLWTEVK